MYGAPSLRREAEVTSASIQGSQSPVFHWPLLTPAAEEYRAAHRLTVAAGQNRR